MSWMDRLKLVIATCFGLGYSPILPGTCGALIGVATYLGIEHFIEKEPWQTIALGVALLFWFSITVGLSDWAEEFFHKKDSGIFVTDEVVGFLITVLLWRVADAPILTILWAFPATRIIDILKIPPAKQLERLPGGWGVVADDVLGSLYAAGLLHIICRLFPVWFRAAAG